MAKGRTTKLDAAWERFVKVEQAPKTPAYNAARKAMSAASSARDQALRSARNARKHTPEAAARNNHAREMHQKYMVAKKAYEAEEKKVLARAESQKVGAKPAVRKSGPGPWGMSNERAAKMRAQVAKVKPAATKGGKREGGSGGGGG